MEKQGNQSVAGRLMLVDRVAAVCLILIGLVVVDELHNESYLVFWDKYGPGPSFLPMLLVAVLLILSLPLMLSGRRLMPEDFGESISATGKFITLSALVTLLFPILGALISLGLFVTVEIVWVERLGLKRALLGGGITVAVTWLLFLVLLAVPLPGGVLDLLFQ